MKARILAGLACAVLVFSGYVEAKEEQKSSSSVQTQKVEQKNKSKSSDSKEAKDLNILRSGLIPITADNNMCVTCHMPEVAKDVGATPIPKSHLYSIRNKKDLEGKLSDDRFNCTTCHVPQANVETKFKNNFKPEYRDANSSQHSNLLDVLNEGVR